jgi:hypothetical protein
LTWGDLILLAKFSLLEEATAAGSVCTIFKSELEIQVVRPACLTLNVEDCIHCGNHSIFGPCLSIVNHMVMDDI